MEHTPLHLYPLERASDLNNWLSSWLPEYAVASHNDWFYQAQETGCYDTPCKPQKIWLWSLPPAAALITLGKCKVKAA